MLRELLNKLKKRKIFYAFIFTLMISVIASKTIFSSFSLLQPVKSVEIFSQNLSYQNNEPGSWKVTKSAKWISSGKARITIDVDTILKTEGKAYKDIIMVLDISGSMSGDKLTRVKEDSIELVNSILSDTNNKMALISFDSNSTLISGLTNDKDTLVNYVNNLRATGCTNYYKALLNVEEILKNYTKQNDRECIVMFLTDGYPNEDTPNQIGEYHYLKDTYPYVTFNGIQYEMGNTILNPIKEISDNQYIASIDTLNNVLFDTIVVPFTYEEFTFTDYIDTNYFNVSSIDNIKSKVGNYSLDGNKVTWTIKDELKSGDKATLTIDVTLKNEYLNIGGTYPTNASETIISKLDDNNENVTSNLTPILSDKYVVTYDGNAPETCTVNNVPKAESKSVFATVQISNTEPICSGYQFKGWEIITEGVEKVNDDYFIMPASDVTLRGVWGKVSIAKSMDGNVYEKLVGTLMEQQMTSSTVLNTNLVKDTIKSVTFVNNTYVPDGVQSWDVSTEQNGSVIAWGIKSGTLYDLYIGQQDGVIANADSSSLFRNMSKLVSINGLENFDTSQVTNMSGMFSNCASLVSVDLSAFTTNNVTNMNSMFYGCSQLESLDLSSFNTQEVTNMQQMFSKCSNLKSVDLSSFYISRDTSGQSMFYNNPLRSDGAVIYVGNEYVQSFVLDTSNRPSDWSIENVIIK